MDIRVLFFKYRSYTPIPLILAALLLARPTLKSWGFGIVTMCLGEALRLWGVSFAGSETRGTTKPVGSILITDGPFSHVRNPLYIGNFLLSFGALIMSWAWMPWMILVFLLLFTLQYGAIVQLEEAYLTGKFHKDYETYRSAVHRWIPKLTPWSGSTSKDPDLKGAIRSERSTFITIGLIWLLFFLHLRLFS